jgi:hypothetical protein
MALESPVQRDGDAGFLGFASRLNPLTLPAGMLQDSVNMRLDRGAAQTRKGAKRLTDNLGTVGAPLTLDFTLGTDRSITSITFSGTTATVTTAAAHGYSNGNQINIRGATGADEPLYNGDFIIAGASGSTFTYTMTGTPTNNATGTLIANRAPIVRSTYEGGLYAAGVFASQRFSNANEYIVVAGHDQAYLWRQGTAIVTKGYPSSPDERIDGTDKVSIVQAFDRLYILREADRTVAGWSSQDVTAGGITVSGTTATVNLTSHGYSAGQRVRIEGSVVPAFREHEYDILAVPNADTFTITVPSGTDTDSVITGRRVRRVKPPIYWDGGSGGFVRASAGIPDEGVSYTKMPSVGWASYINNRLWIAKGRDTVGISDVLDPDLYDPFFNSLRVGAGGNDFIVAIHPWVEGQALIFCRKSIWLATLNQFASTDGSDFSVDTPVSNVTLLTNEIGCSARKTIQTAGQFVFFLSDAGIYRLDSRLDLKLRGDTRPLSEPIADLFSTVEQGRVAESAIAVWHNNRYILALPTSSEPLDGNQLVIAYNSLNESWEYRDILPASASINEMHVSTYSSQRRTFSIPRSGNLYILEENDNGRDDAATGSSGIGITGSIKTRRYDFGDMHSKRFLRTIADVVLPINSTITTKIRTINPDLSADTNDTDPVELRGRKIGELTNSANDNPEDYNMKSPIRYKAHSAEIVYRTSNGRPEIRSASIEASPKSLPPTETRSAA